MTISKERKAELTAKFGKNAQDTGGFPVEGESRPWGAHPAAVR